LHSFFFVIECWSIQSIASVFSALTNHEFFSVSAVLSVPMPRHRVNDAAECPFSNMWIVLVSSPPANSVTFPQLVIDVSKVFSVPVQTPSTSRDKIVSQHGNYQPDHLMVVSWWWSVICAFVTKPPFKTGAPFFVLTEPLLMGFPLAILEFLSNPGDAPVSEHVPLYCKIICDPKFHGVPSLLNFIWNAPAKFDSEVWRTFLKCFTLPVLARTKSALTPQTTTKSSKKRAQMSPPPIQRKKKGCPCG
jgi:hypothetical protein